MEPIAASCAWPCLHPGQYILLGLVVGAYAGLAVWSSDLAARTGHSRVKWFVYGLVAPVVSFVHASLIWFRDSEAGDREFF